MNAAALANFYKKFSCKLVGLAIFFYIPAILLVVASIPFSNNSVVNVQFSNFNDLSIGNIQGVTQVSVSLSTYYIVLPNLNDELHNSHI